MTGQLLVSKKAYILGDSSGRETITRVTGGMKVKADRDESSPYAAMLAAQDVALRCKELGITALHIKIRATGGMQARLGARVFSIAGSDADFFSLKEMARKLLVRVRNRHYGLSPAQE